MDNIRDFRGMVAWDALEIAGIKISDELMQLILYKASETTYFLRIKTLHGFEMDVEIKTIDVLERLLAL